MTGERRWTLLVVCLATGVLLLNVAAPNVALPEIGRGSLVAVGLRDEVSGEIGVFRVEVGGS